MTILNIVLLEDAAYVLTDTLATSQDSAEPTLFTTKVFPVPNWQGVICGTGSVSFLVDWFAKTAGILTTDFLSLNKMAPELLRKLHAQRDESRSEGSSQPCSIHHLGYSSDEGRFVGFSFRSANDFRSERMEYGLCIEPGLGRELDAPISQLPDDLMRLAFEQKRDDEARPILQRIGVGGRLIFYVMELGADLGGKGQVVTIASSICHEFPDYADLYERAKAEGRRQ